jgi:hypothetical protein
MALIAIVHIPDHTAGQRIIDRYSHGDAGRIVGLYEFPNRSELECTGHCVRKGSGAWRRDKLGFMKCGICGSRNVNVRRWLVGHLFDLLGANLYPDAPKLFRTPEGYGPNATITDPAT